mgnify:CR=1 FL=1
MFNQNKNIVKEEAEKDEKDRLNVKPRKFLGGGEKYG